MEENSDIHMETDVSSTTDDVLDTQEVTGSNGQVEMTITVEKVNEGEATSNMESDAQSKTTNNISSGSHLVPSPNKASQSKTTQKSLINNNEAAQSMLKSPAKSESPQEVTSIISPVKSFANTSSDMNAGTADSSTKMDSTSHSKDVTPSKEISEKYYVQSTASQNTKKTIVYVKKSPNKELSDKSPVKDAELQKLHTFQIIRSPSKDKLAEKNKTPEDQKKTFQVIQRASIKSPPIKLVRKQPNKELKIQSANEVHMSNTPIKVNEHKHVPLNKASLPDTSVKDVKLGEVSIKESQLKDSPIKESQLKNSPIEETQLKNSLIKETQLINSPIKESQSKTSPIKETQTKNTPNKETQLNLPINKSHFKTIIETQVKESPIERDSPIKEAQLNALINESNSNDSTIKETKLKNSPIKESQSKETSTKKTELKDSLTKETQVKDLPTKEIRTKDAPNKESHSKDSPIKETQLKNSPIKETHSKDSPIKETHSKDSQIKDIFLKDSPIKENQSIDLTIKNNPLQDTPIGEIKLPEITVKEINLSAASVKEIKLPEIPLQEAKPLDSAKTSSKELSKEHSDTEKCFSPKPSKSVISEPQKQVASIEPMDVETEVSNDSQLSCTASEKEHNRSISRELKSLINSAKESKIINECNQVTSKTRKSRTNIDTSLNTEPEGQDVKKDSQVTESDKPSLKRSMRSQNPEFVTKCKQFLNSVTSKVIKIDNETQLDSYLEVNKQKREPLTYSLATTSKKKKLEETVAVSSKPKMRRSDPYCWRCHWQLEAEANEKQPSHPPMYCTVCVRSYHYKCLTVSERKEIPGKNWVCPDCLQILLAESSDSRSPAMKKISLGMLCELLKYAVERMEALNGVEPFLQPVDRTQFPDYDKIVVHPMDLSLMRQNIVAGHYGSTEAFIADAQWILHNSIIFNASQSKLTSAARTLVRTCRAEMSEIETCPECYAGAHSRNLTYFTDVCSTPHMILWAKLKGFPYWPAKAVAVNNSMVDVRFFGQHDKSWVPVKDCYLYSEKDPNTTKHKKVELMQCRQEAEVHIRNICRKYGTFVYAPFKTTFDNSKMTEQLKLMIPSFDGELKSVSDKNTSPVSKKNRRSTSKSSKSSYNDGDVSESEDASVISESPKTNIEKDLKEIQKEKQEPDPSTSEKNKTMEVDVLQVKDIETPSRKRRRSAAPEPLAESTPLKKKKTDEKNTESGLSKEDTKVAKKCASTKDTDVPNNTENKPIVTKEAEKKTEGKSIVNKDANPIKKTKEAYIVNMEAVTVKMTQEKSLINKQDGVIKNSEQKPSSSTERDITKTSEAEVAEITKKADKSKDTSAEKVLEQKDKSTSLKEQEELRVTPIKLVALPRANKQTPKLFTTAKVDKSTRDSSSSSTTSSNPGTPVDEKRSSSSSSSSSKRSKITKADRFIISEQKDVKTISSQRHSRSNRSQTSTPKSNKTDKNDKTSDSSSDASTSKEKPKKSDPDRSLLKKNHLKQVKDDKKNKKTEDDLTLAAIARENRGSISGYPLISNVISLSTNTDKTITTNKITKTTAKSIEISIKSSSNSTAFTPTSTTNVNDADLKLQNVRNETSSLVGRVGVKAFARMTSPDINDEVQVDIKPEPLDIDELDEERQIEKMDLMNACKLQPVSQTQSLRDVRINKVVVPVIKKIVKTVEPRPRAKKSFPQPQRSEGSELNGKNSMVYIPIQPPLTQQPTKTKPGQHGITMPASVTAGPRPNATVITTNNIVNTVTTPLRPNTTTLTSTSILIPPTTANVNTSFSQPSTVSVPTVGPTTVHTVPLMTSINGQWMFSLQPVMSVGGVDTASSPPMVNGIDRTGSTLVPNCTSGQGQLGVPHITTISRTRPLNANAFNALPANDSGGPELPRLQQRPLMTPFDANSPCSIPSLPTTSGPVSARLNQYASKLTNFFRNIIEDSLEKLEEPIAQVTALKIQLEQARWRYQHHLNELKHSQDVFKTEVQGSFEMEKQKIISETQQAAKLELEAAVNLAKSKQWCSFCQKEAQFYCCWNTSYCDYNCQRKHWKTHINQCTQEASYRQLLQHYTPGVQERSQVDRNCNSLTAAAHAPRIDPLSTSSQRADATVISTHLVNKDGVKRPSLLSYKEILEQTQLRCREQNIIQTSQLTQTQRDLLQSRKQVQTSNSIDKDASESRLQGDNLPKSKPSQAPCLTTMSGKPAPMKVFTDASGTQKTSIIVSMFEDTSGNSTVKCLGTYKAPAQAQAATQKLPLLIKNKQLTSDDSMATKTVTSGGYLIVGPSGNTSSVITPAAAKRPHAQFFS